MIDKIRDSIITGSYAIGENGQKEPLDWKEYALKLEAELLKSAKGDYNKRWMAIINRVEKDNKEVESYSETVKNLQNKYLLFKI